MPSIEPVLSTFANFSASEYLTFILVVVTFYYAVQTRQTVRAMENQNESLTRPYVVIRPLRDGKIFHLQITNTGKTPAENLRLKINTPFHCLDEKDKNLQEQPLFSGGVDSFSPGAEVTYCLGTGPRLFGDEGTSHPMPLQFKIEACYSYEGREVTETTTVDLDQFAEPITLHRGTDREVHKARKALETIAKRFK